MLGWQMMLTTLVPQILGSFVNCLLAMIAYTAISAAQKRIKVEGGEYVEDDYVEQEAVSAIADEIQKEANIESLITAKGFEQCVAVLNGDSASIVVSADTLQPAQIAQINTIVYEQTGIPPTGITIINK